MQQGLTQGRAVPTATAACRQQHIPGCPSDCSPSAAWLGWDILQHPDVGCKHQVLLRRLPQGQMLPAGTQQPHGRAPMGT